jgi:hypothetical protein
MIWSDLVGFLVSLGEYFLGVVVKVLKFFIFMVRTWGLPMLIGCIPYAVVSAWLGYAWSMRIVVNHRRAVLGRRLHRHDRHTGAALGGDA